MNSYIEQLQPAFLELAKAIEKVPDVNGVVQRSAGSKLPEVARSIQHHILRALPPLLEGRQNTTSISLDSRHYVSTNLYNSEQFLYNIHIKRAFCKLVDAGYVTVTGKGWQDRKTGKSDNTKYRLTAKLKEWLTRELDAIGFRSELLALVADPILVPKAPVLRIQRRKKGPLSNHEPRTEKIPFSPSPLSAQVTNEIELINRLLLKTWIDLDLTEEGWANLNKRLGQQNRKDKATFIRFNERQLYRVFHDTEFKTGGRYFGGWWQNIPNRKRSGHEDDIEFRRHLTINGKATVEVDFSGIHPAILYAQRGLPLPDDPYRDILGAEFRPLAKKLFNALINAPHETKNPPRATKISHTGKTWQQIKDRIYELHAPIREYFCTGAGLWLMYEDSQLATEVMLRFADKSIPCLPVHDSFIVHHGYETDLKQYMSEAFQKRYGIEPALKGDEVVFMQEAKSFGPENDIGEILAGFDLPQEHRLNAFRSLSN